MQIVKSFIFFNIFETLIFLYGKSKKIHMNTLAIFILVAFLGNFALHVIADTLNLKNLQNVLPDSFRGWYDETRYKSSQKYLYVNTRFGWVSGFLDMMVFLCVWFGKGFMYLDQWVRSLSHSPVICGLIFIGVLFLGKIVISIPLSIYSTFVIEERFGFNKTTKRVFITDLVKKLILSIILGGILLAAVLGFFEYAGPAAWLYCWGVVVAFMIAMQFVVPAWILPLFNKYTPLADGEIKSAILSYARSINFPLENVFVMDGSKRSAKSNAFFTGFGRHKRVVLYDTLMDNQSAAELLTILAHEMGHYTKRHIFWMMLIGILQSGFMLYLLSLFVRTPSLFAAFYMDHPSVYAGLLFFSMLYAPIDFFMEIVVQIFSRKNEKSADRFAVLTTRDPLSFISALKKLTVHNLSNLTPHPFYVFLNYSHPPVLDRIRSIEAMAPPSL